MNKLTSKVTRFAMMAVILAGLFLSACKPTDIVTTNTKAERAAQNWITQTCRQRPDGTCKVMGEK